MLNVKTLTDTMSRMQLPQLQQYAALHKNDPYIVTLALSIANQKKQMMASKDGQAGMQPQPKVVDQDIAQMVAPPPQQMPPQQGMAPQQGMPPPQQQQALPEDQGIGQLPAPNMQNMAEGGIVAFDDGGSVPGYAGGIFTKDEGFVDPAFTGEEQDSSVLGRFFAQTPEQKRQAAVQNAIMRKKTEITNQRGLFGLKKQNPDEKQAYERTQAEIAYLEKLKNNPNYVPPAGSPLTAPVTPPIAPPVAPAVGQDGAQPLVSAAAPAAAAPPSAAAPSSEDDYMAGINKLLKGSQTGGARPALDAKRYDVTAPQLANATPKDMADRLAAGMGPNPTVSPFAGQQTAVNEANVASRQKYADDLAEQFKNQGEAFKGTLEKLTAKEKRVQTMEDNQLGMSMFEAGLAMMSGDSPYAMVNIGKGAQVGTKKYMEIQNQVEGARDKIDDAKMKIEEFRRNEANMNARELRLAKKDVNDAVSAGAQASLNLMREQYGLKHNEGLAFVNNSYMLDRFNAEQKTLANTHNQSMRGALDMAAADRESRERTAANQNRTQIGLAALEAKRLPAEVRGVMVLGTGKTDAERYESGLRKMTELTADKTGRVYAESYAKHVEDSRRYGTDPMSPEEFATSMKAVLAAMNPSKPTVYDRPK